MLWCNVLCRFPVSTYGIALYLFVTSIKTPAKYCVDSDVPSKIKWLCPWIANSARARLFFFLIFHNILIKINSIKIRWCTQSFKKNARFYYLYVHINRTKKWLHARPSPTKSHARSKGGTAFVSRTDMSILLKISLNVNRR